MKKALCILLILTVGFQLGACAAKPLAQEVIEKEPVTLCQDPAAASADFAISLLQSCYESKDENLVLSPYSALIALAMGANGADGETLAQMEELFGMRSEELNNFLKDCFSDTRENVISANAIWVQEDYPLEEAFLQTNQNYFQADVHSADFAAEQTLAQINDWVSRNTKERIPKLLEELDPDTVMMLINALTFDAKWKKPFAPEKTREGTFYAASGEKQSVQMMSGTVQNYLDDGMATGFVKDYENGYSFVALLPKEGTSMEDYLASLSGESLMQTLANASQENVSVTMPKLETETALELQGSLSNMGMELAFSKKADFSRVDGTRDLYVSKVLHKTLLKVDEEGTEAAAVTSMDFAPKSAPIHIGNSVVLDRPFVMVIFDRQSNVILFAGVINQAAE